LEQFDFETPDLASQLMFYSDEISDEVKNQCEKMHEMDLASFFFSHMLYPK